MKKIINISLWIYAAVFLILILLRLLFNARLYIHSETFFDVRLFYYISVILALFVLRRISTVKNQTAAALKDIVTRIIIVIMLLCSGFLLLRSLFCSDSVLSNYTKVKNENTNEEYVILESSTVRTHFISVGKLYFNCLLVDKGKIPLESESSTEINEIRWEDDDTMIFDCTVYSEINNERKNELLKFTLED